MAELIEEARKENLTDTRTVENETGNIVGGSEGFGYALMMSVRNIAVFGVSDVVGSLLYGRFHLGFDKLVWINAGSSAAVLLFVPFLPAALLASREGKVQPET